MATYVYASHRELHGKLFEFRAAVRNIERGVNDDGDGGFYPDPEKQKQWFKVQIKEIEEELERRRWL